jgi:UDP-N-acetylglucosamine 2-epimerase (non-hydrolysing)/GDP/UDP-N,N'-diacetylbacillosamine 2-epimerase (hydrolysing)
MSIPTAHIEGGDITEGGSLDDSTRHAITKLAHLHFTTNAQASERVLALGEEPWRVQMVGLPVLDLVAQGHYAAPEEVASRYDLDLSRPLIVFTQHSVATEFEYAAAQIRPSLEGLHRVAKDGYQVVITFPNNDAGGQCIIEEIERFGTLNLLDVQIHKSLGRHFYHGMLNVAGRFSRGVCAGNSSSGIKETPAFGCPTVNIGSRQRSRLRGGNVVDVEYDAKEIEDAIRRGVEDHAWRATCRATQNPYGQGDAGKRIAEVLSMVDLNLDLVQKKMTI